MSRVSGGILGQYATTSRGGLAQPAERPALQSLFCPLRQQIEWGHIIACMLTGILNEHPRAAIACRESENKDKYAEFYERLLEGVIDES